MVDRHPDERDPDERDPDERAPDAWPPWAEVQNGLRAMWDDPTALYSSQEVIGALLVLPHRGGVEQEPWWGAFPSLVHPTFVPDRLRGSPGRRQESARAARRVRAGARASSGAARDFVEGRPPARCTGRPRPGRGHRRAVGDRGPEARGLLRPARGRDPGGNPSTWLFETCGRAPVEALVAGLPRVAPDWGPLRAVCSDAVGYPVSARSRAGLDFVDTETLASVLDHALSDVAGRAA